MPSLTDVPGVLVGHAQDEHALTGCTAILVEGGAVAGVDVRGGAPGTRETDLLDPRASVHRVHGLVFAGGSAFGLDAACGVVRYLDERGVGHQAGAWRVPIVPAAILFDLAIGDGHVRPDAAMGYEAARCAGAYPVAEGNVGAGCGATAGKVNGIAWATKSGLGSWSVQRGALIVGALCVPNPFGAIVDRGGRTIAGVRTAGGGFADATEALAHVKRFAEANTTLAVVATNAKLTKAQANKVAAIAQTGIARCIVPAHTGADGDIAFALALGTVEAQPD